MSIFSRLFGRSDPPDSESLRQTLFQAGAAGDRATLKRQCKAHQMLIKVHFTAWRRVPEAIRQQPEQIQLYMHGLVGIAQTFAQYLGDPSLMQELVGTPENNPALRWQQGLQQAQTLIGQLRYRDAVGLLTDLLIDVRGNTGTAVDTYLPVSFGHLGDCYFQSGEADKALAPTTRALELCQQHNDREGVVAYLGNLYEIQRYLGHAVEAASFAEQLAAAFAEQGQTREAQRYRNQATLVRAGEPLNRVVAEIAQQRYELDEVLQGVEGGVKFYFERNRLTLKPCQVLTDRGKELGSQGKFDEALPLFREAMQADAFAPDPHYQAALTLMHLHRAVEAVECYERTEELAPGWFHCRAELWLARQVVLERYPVEMFLACATLEDAPFSPAQKVQLAEQALQRAPDLAILHYLHGKNLKALNRADDATRALRRALAVADEPDLRSRVLMELASVISDKDESRRMLHEAASLAGNLVAAATARIMLAFA